MCIACELGLLIAVDELPDGPPPGFPGARPQNNEASRFACDAPEGEQAKAAMPKDEPAP